MSNTRYVQKEKAEGTWNGEEVRFNRTWRGHRFTDEEVAALLAGQEIKVHDLTSKKGGTYGVKGKLAYQSFINDDGEEIEFLGFEQLGFVNEPGVPGTWCQHKFTDDERQALEAGEKVFVTGFVSAKGNTFDCEVSYIDEDGDGEKRITPHFQKR